MAAASNSVALADAPNTDAGKKKTVLVLLQILISQLCMHLAANHDAFTRREREPAQFSTDAWTGQGTVSQDMGKVAHV